MFSSLARRDLGSKQVVCFKEEIIRRGIDQAPGFRAKLISIVYVGKPCACISLLACSNPDICFVLCFIFTASLQLRASNNGEWGLAEISETRAIADK